MTANFEGVDVVPLPGAIVWLGGRVTNFGGVDVVPLLVPSYGAIVYYGCGEGDDQLWEWTWCHCRVPL